MAEVQFSSAATQAVIGGVYAARTAIDAEIDKFDDAEQGIRFSWSCNSGNTLDDRIIKNRNTLQSNLQYLFHIAHMFETADSNYTQAEEQNVSMMESILNAFH